VDLIFQSADRDTVHLAAGLGIEVTSAAICSHQYQIHKQTAKHEKMDEKILESRG
jgi:hypothetical protein